MAERLPSIVPRRHLLLIAGLAALGLLALSFGRMLLARYELSQRAEAIRQEIGELQGENARLQQELAYWRGDEGVERLAREELGWGRPGESVALVESAGAPRAREAPPAAPSQETVPNWRRWWQFFFGG